MVRDLPLAIPERVDEGVLRLDLSSPMQQVLEEVLKGVLDTVLDVVHFRKYSREYLWLHIGKNWRKYPGK